MMLCETLMSVLVATQVPVSVGGAAAVVILLFFWFSRRLRDIVAGAPGLLFDNIETLTTGWSSPPLPAGLPGPRGIPLLGYLPFLGHLPHKTLAVVAARFGGRPFRLSAGSRRFVVISRIETLRQLSGRYANQLRGKPQTFTTQQMTLGAHNDMVQRWKRRRAYTDAGVRLIQNTTNGEVLNEEVGGLINFLSTLAEPGDICHDVTLTAARVMYRLAYGRCPDKVADEGLRHIVHTLPDYTTTIGSLSWVDLFPVWRLLCRSVLAKFAQFNRFVADFCRREKRRSLDELDKNDELSLPVSLFEFFRRKFSRMSTEDRNRFALDEDVLFDGLEDIIRAGSESSSLVAQWFLLYIATFPQVQERMRQELEDRGSALGNPLTVDDVRSLPYCCAAFAEACRFCSVNPFLKRELTDDIELDGVQLLRGTVLLFNTWAINNDRHNWTDPELFRPERFLTENGAFDEDKMMLFVPFGFGKRRCIGVETGRALGLLIAASVVRHFNVTLDSDLPDFEPVFGIGLAPKPYRLQFDLRS